jgi:hypothetical protein
MYTTKINIKKIDRAFTVDLSSTNPPLQTTVKRPHMTLLFSRIGYPDGTLQRLEALASQKGTVSFTLEQWGKRSDLVKGELYDFFQEVKKEFPKLISDRKPHVQIR